MKQYFYGIIFWNEITDKEVYCYVKAESYFDAEKISAHESPDGLGWNEGSLHYIEEQDMGDKIIPIQYIPLFDFVMKKTINNNQSSLLNRSGWGGLA